MGWSWSLFFCQKVHERATESLGLPASQRLVDGQAAPTLADGPMHMEYVDNFAALALQLAQANGWTRSVPEKLKQLGLPMHELEDATPETKLLGWSIEGARGVSSPTRERGWKLRLALLEICRRGRASGRDIERLVGHATFVALLGREIPSVFASVYTFARRHYERPRGYGRRPLGSQSSLPTCCRWSSRTSRPLGRRT